MPATGFIMFDLIGNTIMSIVWGILISSLLTGLLFFVPGMLYSRYSHTAQSLIALVVGFLFLTFQSTLMIGGIKSKKYIPDAEAFISSLPIPVSAISGQQTAQDIQQTVAQVSEQFPLFGKHINRIATAVYLQADQITKPSDLIQAITLELQSQINRYIGRRVGWIVGGITILVFFLLSSANKQSRNMELLRQSSIYTGGF